MYIYIVVDCATYQYCCCYAHVRWRQPTSYLSCNEQDDYASAAAAHVQWWMSYMYQTKARSGLNFWSTTADTWATCSWVNTQVSLPKRFKIAWASSYDIDADLKCRTQAWHCAAIKRSRASPVMERARCCTYFRIESTILTGAPSTIAKPVKTAQTLKLWAWHWQTAKQRYWRYRNSLMYVEIW